MQHDSNAPSKTDGESEFYDRPGNTRNLCFGWPDGTMEFFNYAYLVSCKISVGEDTNRITLKFTSDTVIVQGYNLSELFLGLISQTPSLITKSDSRYVQTMDEKNFAVTEITVVPNQE